MEAEKKKLQKTSAFESEKEREFHDCILETSVLSAAATLSMLQGSDE